MNHLLIGTQQTLPPIPEPFLLIDDEIDLELSTRRKVVRFDYTKHSFNPISKINYQRAREIISVFDSIFPEGENTLTRKSSNFVLLNALLSSATKLSRLIRPNPKDPGQTDAYEKIQTLLLSPVLHSVLNRPTNFAFDGIILARLNRAELGDFDCFVLGNLLISQYRGQVVIPDFGFYGRAHHMSLIRQERLIAGVNSLDELPKELRQRALLMEKTAQHCTPADAEVLAGYEGLIPHTNGYNEFVQRCIE